ncbi:tail completion protein gp17 [Methylobacterium dankookense]|uniref:DUF3168 domain-containing protein n=1 Tax=Methylobacterium dankookense TaxID=560405 RepID=A0A564FVM8_9HYPH|nr:DUF3168 domain-containing protein [Methylobacterium dankookense]GJD59665.1 hypothetical protein IFDJLNFL_5595 [Methylobacterium dankookense]VUF12209.1 hypothetical protein MTDSW087_01898 [Methylobacterium dankookense]
MSAASLLALRAALLARFAGDPALAALMGGAVRLHDEPPRGSVPVYALFGEAGSRDDSVDGARRAILSHALIVIARPGSARTALDAAARMAALAEDGLALTGHTLVSLVAESLSASRDERSGEARAILTLRAVTETP